jgi:hypothetical protein
VFLVSTPDILHGIAQAKPHMLCNRNTLNAGRVAGVMLGVVNRVMLGIIWLKVAHLLLFFLFSISRWRICQKGDLIIMLIPVVMVFGVV